MAANAKKSDLVSQATIVLLLVVTLANESRTAEGQTCSNQLASLDVCAPFLVPGAANPSTECCNALSAVQQDCLCGTLAIAARMPSMCNIPSIPCNAN